MSILVTKNKPTVSTVSDTYLNETRLTKVHDFWEPKPRLPVRSLTEAAELVAAISVLDFDNKQTESELGEYRSKMATDLQRLPFFDEKDEFTETLPLPCLVLNHGYICEFLGGLLRLQASKQHFYQFGLEKLAQVEDLAIRVRQERYHALAQFNELKIRNISNYRHWADQKSANELKEFLTRELFVLVDLESQKNEILSVQLSKLKAKKSTVVFKEKFLADTLLKTTGSIKAATILLNKTEECVNKTENQIKKVEIELKKSDPEKQRLEKEKLDLKNKIKTVQNDSTDLKSKINKFNCGADDQIEENPNKEIRIFYAIQKRLKMKEESAEETKILIKSEKDTAEKLRKKLDLALEKENFLKSEINKKMTQLQSLQSSTQELETESKLAVPKSNYSVSQISRSLKEFADTQENGQREFDNLRHQLKQEAMVQMAKFDSTNQLLRNKIEYVKSALEAQLKKGR